MVNFNAVIVLLVFMLFSGTFVQSAKILCLFPTPSRSQVIVAQALMKGLAEQGHDVTVVSSFPLDKNIKNYRDIVVDNYDETTEFKISDLITDFISGEGKNRNFFLAIPKLINIVLKVSHIAINSPQFKKVMAEESFDLMILGAFLNEYLLGVGAHFNCPIIVLTTVQANGMFNGLVANPTAVSHVPHLFLGYKEQMNFSQRLKNMFVTIAEKLVLTYLNMRYSEYYSLNFPSDKYPSLNEMKKNVSMVLVNHHFTQGNPRPYVQNMIEIGGVQVKEKPNPLPEDIKNWLESNKNGAIFFSMGSNIRSADLPKIKLNALLQTFSKLKQNVIWKFETDLPDLPKNVKIYKWLPQDDILAHPNVKLFISHGGASSIMESKYHGVPILGIPLFGDQMTNLDMAENEGWSVVVPFSELTEERLSPAINEILTNPRYTNTAKTLSALYRDRPATALKTAIYWVEYVIRHKGAKHMQSHGVHLNFFQYHSLDVWGFIIVVLLMSLKLFCLTIKLFMRKICKTKTQTDNKSTSKKNKKKQL